MLPKDKPKSRYALQPETVRMLKRAALLMSAIYALSLLLYRGAGTLLDYQAALVLSERLAAGLRAGFGLLCLGFLFMECK